MHYNVETGELTNEQGIVLGKMSDVHPVFQEWLKAREAFLKELTLAATGNPDAVKLVTTANVFEYVCTKMQEGN